jgi:hypothetical protein
MDNTPPLHRIEHIFNRLRWKYLQAIACSPALCDSPSQAISAKYNWAFLALAGLTLRQKPDRPRQGNDWFWESMGFDPSARHDLDWQVEREALAAALHDLIRDSSETATTTYAEVIALKPGFHEAWLHDEFPNDAYEGPDKPRGRVFAILRGSPLDLLDLDGSFPADLNSADAFLGYAPCSVTEGPFVRRKRPDVSYFEELKGVGEITSFSGRRTILRESFEVLDTWQRLHDQNDRAALEALILAAEAFVDSPLSDHLARYGVTQ